MAMVMRVYRCLNMPILTSDEKLALIAEYLEDYQTGRVSLDGLLIAISIIIRVGRKPTEADIKWAEK